MRRAMRYAIAMSADHPVFDAHAVRVATYAAGNRTTRVALWDEDGNVLLSQQLPTEGLAKKLARSPQDEADDKGLTRGYDVVAAGVVPEILEALDGKYRGLKKIRFKRFRRTLPCALEVVPQPAEKVGDDRLAAALGALAVQSDCPWVVIDAGTAMTVNSVRPAKDGNPARFEGGLIVPGEALALRALHGGTKQLPELEPLPPEAQAPAVGRSTEEAMRAGVRRAQAAAAVAETRAQLEALGSGARVALTGGGAEALLGELNAAFGSVHHDPMLVERGLFAAWKAAQQAAGT